MLLIPSNSVPCLKSALQTTAFRFDRLQTVQFLYTRGGIQRVKRTVITMKQIIQDAVLSYRKELRRRMNNPCLMRVSEPTETTAAPSSNIVSANISGAFKF